MTIDTPDENRLLEIDRGNGRELGVVIDGTWRLIHASILDGRFTLGSWKIKEPGRWKYFYEKEKETAKFDCKKCLHEKVCELWSQQESQNASCFCLDGCDHFSPIAAQQNKHLGPCDVCIYDPPSSLGGKPCFMCPASGRPAEGEEADLARVKAERDAAIADWRGFCAKCVWNGKQYLADGKMDDRCKTCRENGKCNWEWHGIKED